MKEVCPVPPWETAAVPTRLAKLMPREEVASAVGTAALPETFARTELAAMEARPMVAFDPPIWYPSDPAETVRPVPAESEEVATFAKVLTPLKYGMLPMTAAVEVESPLKPRVAPESVMGQVTEMAFCFAFQVAELVMRSSARVPIQYGAKVWTFVALVTVMPRFVSAVEVAKVWVPPVCPVE